MVDLDGKIRLDVFVKPLRFRREVVESPGLGHPAACHGVDDPGSYFGRARPLRVANDAKGLPRLLEAPCQGATGEACADDQIVRCVLSADERSLELDGYQESKLQQVVNFFQSIAARIFPGRGILKAGSSRAERGRYGEDLAAHYCRRELGYRVLVRNWQSKKDELDLVCMDGEILVFVEVRARAEEALVSGYASVDARKKKVLQRACKRYLKQLKNPPKHFRFDIIDVTLTDGGRGKVRHYANVPLFHKHYTAH